MTQFIERDITQEEYGHMMQGFKEHSLEHGVIEPEERKRLTVVVQDGETFLGCISGLVDFNWFYITDLWLEKNQRGKGLGRQLIERLEVLILQEGIKNVYTWTAGYEAPPFYKRQGYRIFAEMENWFPTGDSRVGFRKDLEEANHGLR